MLENLGGKKALFIKELGSGRAAGKVNYPHLTGIDVEVIVILCVAEL